MNAVATLQPLESIADDLVSSCRTISRHGYRLLVLLREFDMRRGYREARGKGRCAADSAEWLDARCGIGRDAVRDKLRVAYALLNLPQIEAAFEDGELTFAKVRALIEVATFDNERTLLDFACTMSDAQVAGVLSAARCPGCGSPRLRGQIGRRQRARLTAPGRRILQRHFVPYLRRRLPGPHGTNP